VRAYPENRGHGGSRERQKRSPAGLILGMRKQVVRMKARRSRVHWDLVVKTAVLVYIVTFILGLGLSFPLLAFLTWSRLSSQSAFLASSLITTFFVIVVTGYGALRLARRVENAALLHGLLVGLLVALISLVLDVLFIRAIELLGLGLHVLMVASGVLGGVLGSRRHEQS
jgi:putative membrane protein (TIGR04086 family)